MKTPQGGTPPPPPRRINKPPRPHIPSSPRAEATFLSVLDRPSEEREAYLARACEGDAALKAEVAAMLAAHRQAGDFMEHPPLSPEVAAELARCKPEESGDHIVPYKLLQEIGVGGFGTVWMADQEQPVRRRVALKIIKVGMDTKEVIARFEQERQALAMMDHPNIARVFDAGATQHGRPYFVMELVKGVPITEFCDERQLGTRERLKLFADVCSAINHAHQKGIIHRDIKPSNVMVTMHGERAVTKVIDFGIAKATQNRLTDKTLLTRFEQFIGTPVYMSPEQATLSGLDIDTRSDIYALGVLLYELLTGKPPFDAHSLVSAGYEEMRRIIREVEPPKPSSRLSTVIGDERALVAKARHIEPEKLGKLVERDLDWIVMKAIEKDRNRRYETANAFAQDITLFLADEAVSACPPSAAYRCQKFARRNRVALRVVALIATVLVAATAISSWQAIRAYRAEQTQINLRKEAEIERTRAANAATKSNQIAEFLKEMLRGVGPSVALGRDTTMLREIADKTVDRVDRDLTEQPEVRAEIQNTLGQVFRALGQYAKAEKLHSAALLAQQQLFGEENAVVALTLYDLANAIRYQGRLTEAEPLFRRALALQIKVPGSSRLSVAASIDHIASVLAMQNNFGDAEPLFREALAIRRSLLGNDSREVAKSLDHLATVLADQGALQDAETIQREALEMRIRILGKAHPEVAHSLSGLAMVLDKRGDLSAAEPYYRDAFRLNDQMLDDSHPFVRASFNQLIDALLRMGRLDEIESLKRTHPALFVPEGKFDR